MNETRLASINLIRHLDGQPIAVTYDLAYIYRPAGYLTVDDPEWIELVQAVEQGVVNAEDELDTFTPSEFREAEEACMEAFRARVERP